MVNRASPTCGEERKFAEAIAIYETLETQDKDNSTGWRWQIAECYESDGKLREAIGSYRLTDKYPHCLDRMASCHRRLKEHAAALDLYGQIITAYADSGASARFNIGETYEEMGKSENAIRAFQQVCRDYPKSGQASRAHAHLQTKYKINVTLGGAKDE
jgi:tetratricopeptide (TPR) repeat protein